MDIHVYTVLYISCDRWKDGELKKTIEGHCPFGHCGRTASVVCTLLSYVYTVIYMYMRVYTYLPMMLAGISACSAITLCRLCCIVTPRSCGELTLSTAKESPFSSAICVRRMQESRRTAPTKLDQVYTCIYMYMCVYHCISVFNHCIPDDLLRELVFSILLRS